MKKSTFKQKDRILWEVFLKGEIPNDYSQITKEHITSIWHDTEPLYHWRTIIEMIYEVDTEVLEFILQMKVPFDRLILHELEVRKRDIEIQEKKFGKK